MDKNVLSSQTNQFLKKLKANNFPKNTYLGGGTAVALHLGHRRSNDLDFFTPTEFVEKQWEQKLKIELDFKLAKRDWQTLIGDIKGVKFSLFGYKYKLIGEFSKIYAVNIASLPDLSAMKLDTVLTRGTKRDLIDIYFLAQKFGLIKLYEYYQKKYSNFEEREIMIKKALVYFEEAEADEMPEMLIALNWEEVKKYFRKNISLS